MSESVPSALQCFCFDSFSRVPSALQRFCFCFDSFSCLPSALQCYPQVSHIIKRKHPTQICTKAGIFPLKDTRDFHHDAKACTGKQFDEYKNYGGKYGTKLSPREKARLRCEASPRAMRGYFGRAGVVVYKRARCKAEKGKPTRCWVQKSAKCYTCANRIFPLGLTHVTPLQKQAAPPSLPGP